MNAIKVGVSLPFNDDWDGDASEASDEDASKSRKRAIVASRASDKQNASEASARSER